MDKSVFSAFLVSLLMGPIEIVGTSPLGFALLVFIVPVMVMFWILTTYSRLSYFVRVFISVMVAWITAGLTYFFTRIM